MNDNNQDTAVNNSSHSIKQALLKNANKTLELFHITTMDKLKSIQKYGLIAPKSAPFIYFAKDEETAIEWMEKHYPKVKRFALITFEVEVDDKYLQLNADGLQSIIQIDTFRYISRRIAPQRLSFEEVNIKGNDLDFYEVDKVEPVSQVPKKVWVETMKEASIRNTSLVSKKEAKLLSKKNYKWWANKHDQIEGLDHPSLADRVRVAEAQTSVLLHLPDGFQDKLKLQMDKENGGGIYIDTTVFSKEEKQLITMLTDDKALLEAIEGVEEKEAAEWADKIMERYE